MGDAGFFRGTSTTQDSRFSDKEKRLLKTMKFPKCFEKKVEMKKVEMTVIKSWISKRVTEILGFEDEVVIGFIFGLLEEEKVDPKRSQINITGFLEQNAATFMKELWELLLSAQESPNGIPQKFIEEKKQEILNKKKEEEEMLKRVHKEMEKEKDYVRESLEHYHHRDPENYRRENHRERERVHDSSSRYSRTDRYRRQISRSPSPHNRSKERNTRRSPSPKRYRSKERSSRRSPSPYSNRRSRRDDYYASNRRRERDNGRDGERSKERYERRERDGEKSKEGYERRGDRESGKNKEDHEHESKD